MSDELKHKTVGIQLTQDEWEGASVHVFDSQALGDIPYASSSTQISRLGIGTEGKILASVSSVPAWIVPGNLGATCYVVANDAPAVVKTWATYMQSAGYNVWVCDGTADEVQIQAAIDALPSTGGRIRLSGGAFSISATVNFNKSNSILDGEGQQASAVTVASSITNSFNITGLYCEFHDFKVDGNSLATQFLNSGGYNKFRNLYLTGHTTYNLYLDNNVSSLRDSWIYKKPIRIDGAGVIIEGNNFNGDGADGCIEVSNCIGLNILGNVFESYASTYCIGQSASVTMSAWVISGNYFESSADVSYGIYLRSDGGVDGLEISGNYEADAGATVTNFIYVGYCRGGEVKNNRMYSQTFIGTGVLQLEFDSYYQGCTYNSLNALYHLKITRGEGDTFYYPNSPSVGTWDIGDKAYDSSPSSGGTMGWVCTASGTPGTWNTFGSIG